MRIVTIMFIVLTISFFVYNVKTKEMVHLQTNSGIDYQFTLNNKLDELMDALKTNQLANQEQLSQTQTEQNNFQKILKEIDARLKLIESPTSDQNGNSIYSENKVQNHNNVTQYQLNKKQKSQFRISESDFGTWMDKNTIDHNDATATTLAAEQATNTLESRPDLELDDMQCSDRFCRATFTLHDTDQSAVVNLFGHPPFLNSGFNVIQPDGRVLVYFAQPNVSLAELRNEAKQSLQY